jgi:predicted PurR-regulated permease PerM
MRSCAPSNQPLEGWATLMGSIAAGALNIITWTVLIVLISYFLLAETEGFPGQLSDTDIVGQREDMQRIGEELNLIWSAFIRGELLIVLISYVIYTILLGTMRVQFFVGLAAIAALWSADPLPGSMGYLDLLWVGGPVPIQYPLWSPIRHLYADRVGRIDGGQ